MSITEVEGFAVNRWTSKGLKINQDITPSTFFSFCGPLLSPPFCCFFRALGLGALWLCPPPGSFFLFLLRRRCVWFSMVPCPGCSGTPCRWLGLFFLGCGPQYCVCDLRWWPPPPLPLWCGVLLLVVLCVAALCGVCGAVLCLAGVSPSCCCAAPFCAFSCCLLPSGCCALCCFLWCCASPCRGAPCRLVRRREACRCADRVVLCPTTAPSGWSCCCVVFCVLFFGAVVWCGLLSVVPGDFLWFAVLWWCAGALLFGVLSCCAVGFVAGCLLLALAAPLPLVSCGALLPRAV